MRPDVPTWVFLPVSSSRCTRSMPTRYGLAVDLDVEVALDAQRLVVLRDLEVLRHVRVEVVLAREAAPRRDRAVQRQADLDRRLDRRLVDDRQRAGQAQADRAGVRVRLGAELGRAAAEHLRRGAEFDVRLEADDRLVLGQHFLVGQCSCAQLRDRGEDGLDGRLEGRADAVAALVGQRRRHDLQADRQPLATARRAPRSPAYRRATRAACRGR